MTDIKPYMMDLFMSIVYVSSNQLSLTETLNQMAAPYAARAGPVTNLKSLNKLTSYSELSSHGPRSAKCALRERTFGYRVSDNRGRS